MRAFVRDALQLLAARAQEGGLLTVREQRVHFEQSNELSAHWYDVPMVGHFVHQSNDQLRSQSSTVQLIESLRVDTAIEPPVMVDSQNQPLIPSRDQIEKHIYDKLEMLLTAYIELTEGFEFQSSAADHLSRDFLQTWTSGAVTRQVLVPLLFFACNTPPVKLTHDISLVRISPEEKTTLWKPSIFEPSAISATQMLSVQAALLGNYISPSAIKSSASPIVNEVSDVVLALRILKAGDVFPGAYYDQVVSRVAGPGRSGGILAEWRPLPKQPAEYVLLDSDVQPLRELLANINESRSQRTWSNLSIALRRFQLTYNRSNFEDQVIDLTIGLESTLLFGLKDELKYRLSLRGAYLLREEISPEKSVQLLRKLYDIRSGIVHEGKSLQSFATKTGIAGMSPDQFVSAVLDWYRCMLKVLIPQLAGGSTLRTVVDSLDGAVIESLNRL